MAQLTLAGAWRDLRRLVVAPHRAFFDPRYFFLCACVVLLLEVAVVAVIIWLVPYTEIDWVAYIQEVEGFLNGSWNYTDLRGDTGPLVYPAGFVYIYSVLYYITDHGANIRLAQCIFAALYLATLAAVLWLYCHMNKSQQYPPYLLVFLCCTAYRVHSIFVLRLFNDPVAMFLLYIAICLFVTDWWDLGCAVYSLAVSVKMNILLFSPGLLVVLLLRHGWRGTLPRLILCASVQLVLGAPFLLGNPRGYVVRSFDLGRQFLYQWTVNWRCLPEWLFLHRGFHLLLLSSQLTVLGAFTIQQWTRLHGWKCLFQWKTDKQAPRLASEGICWILFTSNFIGVCFSRSLHYQFYIWYFHTLPALLWSTRLHPALRVVLLLAVEYCWNTYPSTVPSSLLLHFCHLTLLIALYLRTPSHTAKTE